MVRSRVLALVALLPVTLALFIVGSEAYAGRAEIKTVGADASKALYELPRKSLYGVGVADDGASITAINGNFYIARLNSKETIVLDDSFKTKTTSMIYSNVTLWTEVPLTKEIATPADLYKLIDKTQREFGYENPGTVPFLIKGVVPMAKFKVGSKTFSEKNADAIVVGYFTKTVLPAGEPTFKSTMNIVLQKKKQAGQLEEFSPLAGTSLFLPR